MYLYITKVIINKLNIRLYKIATYNKPTKATNSNNIFIITTPTTVQRTIIITMCYNVSMVAVIK